LKSNNYASTSKKTKQNRLKISSEDLLSKIRNVKLNQLKRLVHAERRNTLLEQQRTVVS